MARDTVLTKRMIRREKADRTDNKAQRVHLCKNISLVPGTKKKDFGRSVTANLVSA
jgi:hypothetical protein